VFQFLPPVLISSKIQAEVQETPTICKHPPHPPRSITDDECKRQKKYVVITTIPILIKQGSCYLRSHSRILPSHYSHTLQKSPFSRRDFRKLSSLRFDAREPFQHIFWTYLDSVLEY